MFFIKLESPYHIHHSPPPLPRPSTYDMLISGAHSEKDKKKEKSQAEGASKATSRAVAASSNNVHTIVDGMVPVPGLDEGEEEEEEEEEGQAVEFGEAGREGV